MCVTTIILVVLLHGFDVYKKNLDVDLFMTRLGMHLFYHWQLPKQGQLTKYACDHCFILVATLT